MSTPELNPAATATAVLRAPIKPQADRRAASVNDPVLRRRALRDRAIARLDEVMDAPPGSPLDAERQRRAAALYRTEKRLLGVPARSIEGILYKLSVLFEIELQEPAPEEAPGDGEDPERWGLQQIIDDLKRLAAKASAAPGDDAARILQQLRACAIEGHRLPGGRVKASLTMSTALFRNMVGWTGPGAAPISSATAPGEDAPRAADRRVA